MFGPCFSVALPHGAVCWSAVCDYSISWSHTTVEGPSPSWSH